MPTEFSLKEIGGAVSLFPSIGNWNFPCQSHYWIKGGRVIVAPPMTQNEILRGRQYDDAQKAAYFSIPRVPWWAQFAAAIKAWLGIS